MNEIDKFKKELNDLVEKYNAKLYIEQNNIQNSAELCIDLPKSSYNTIFSDDEEIDYLSERERCTECGEIIQSSDEIESEMCQSCINEATNDELSFQESMTESWNNR